MRIRFVVERFALDLSAAVTDLRHGIGMKVKFYAKSNNQKKHKKQ